MFRGFPIYSWINIFNYIQRSGPHKQTMNKHIAILAIASAEIADKMFTFSLKTDIEPQLIDITIYKAHSKY